MTQVPLKFLLYAFGGILGLLFATGIIQFRTQPYDCIGKWEFGFSEKVEVVRIGAFVVNAYPLVRDCPEERRYDYVDLEKAIKEIEDARR